MKQNIIDTQMLVMHDSLSFDSSERRRRKWKRRTKYASITVGGLVLLGGFCFVLFYFIKIEFYNRHLDIHKNLKNSSAVCTGIADLDKFDCFPDESVTEEKCLSRGCCYQVVTNNPSKRLNYLHISDSDFDIPSHANEKNVGDDNPKINVSWLPPLDVPYCYYPANYVGYRISNITTKKNLFQAVLTRAIPSGFPQDVKNLSLYVQEISENTLEIKIKDPNNKRFEVPISPQYPKKKWSNESQLYEINLNENGMLSVTRKSSGATVFSTNLSRLVFADQFLQLSTHLPSPYIYGLGEHYDRLLRNVNWTRTTLFNRDNFPSTNINLYGTHPIYLSIENDSRTHGVVLLNSNSMDIILQPTPAVTFRTVGGILDFYIFLGPTPENIVQQYTQIVGRPFMPPYWSLGFHLCKFGYGSLNETEKVWKRTRDAGIPFDVQWNDIDYMDRRNDFTYNKVDFKGLPEFVDKLHDLGMHYVIIIDPGISNAEPSGSYPPYDEGLADDIFVKNSTGGIFIGKVWNKVSTVFPDFSHPAAVSYWTRQFKRYHDLVKYDGAWIDMNEPSNFESKYPCPTDSPLENPQYVPGGLEPLSSRTICVSAKHYYTTHYNEHSLYAYRQAIATNLAMKNITGKRPFIISRASFAGQGVYSGHWSGDISSTWEDMRYSVIDMLNFNIFGMPMMGSDICGFAKNTTIELCARWSTLGAFYPFSRNHNDFDAIPQDPVALGRVVTAAAKNALTMRYRMLPYLYTLFYRSHVFGDTVAKPLFFEFLDDRQTYSIDEQFLLGPSVMVIPALYPGVTTVKAYIPKGLWYEFNSGIKRNSSGEIVTLPAPLDSINVAVRGGYILPLQKALSTTTESRLTEFSLMALLDETGRANGELYWDDGESLGIIETKAYNLIKFSLENNILSTTVVHNGFHVPMNSDVVMICSLDSNPDKAFVNGNPAGHEFKNNCLYIFTDGLSLLQANKISWK